MKQITLILTLLCGSVFGQYTVPLHTFSGGSTGGSTVGTCGTGYTHYGVLSIQGAQITAALSAFPVYFAGNSALTTATSSSGYDIIACSASSGGTQIPMDTVAGSFNSSTGVIEQYIQVPSIASGSGNNTTIYIFWGNSSVTTDQSNRPATWNSYYLVEHFGTPSSLNYTDSSGNVTVTATNSPTAATGKIGGGVNLNGSSQYFSGTLPVSLSKASQFTMSAWVNPSATGHRQIMEQQDGGGYVPQFSSGLYINTYLGGLVGNSETGGDIANTSTTPSTGTWYYINGIANGSTISTSVNGGAATTTNYSYANGTEAANPQPYMFGIYRQESSGGPTYTNYYYFSGVMDEIRIANFAETDAWRKAEYANQSSPTTFYTFTQVI